MSSQLDQSSKKKVSKSRRPDGSTRSTRSQRSARSEKSTRSAKSGRPGRSHRSDKSGRSGKSSRSSKCKKPSGSASKSSEIPSKKEEDPDAMKLLYKGGDRKVKIADLVEVSTMMKQRQSEGRLAKAVDLKEFTPECVNFLADYIVNKTVKTSLSFFALAEVLKLSKAFVMENLYKKMEEVLTVAATQSAANLMQGLLVVDTSSVSRETETSLHYLAAWRFLELARLDDFHKIPANQFLMIFGSCELNVSQELVAVDAALYWLAPQRNLEVLAPAIFGMVRSTYLSKLERNMIIERTTVLNFPDKVTRLISVLLNSRNNNRICFTPEHIRRHLVRCGVADPKKKTGDSALPLSRPREGLVRKKEDKSSKSSRKSERTGKKCRKSERSTRSEKSCKSQRSSKKGSSEKSEKSCTRTSSRRESKHQKMSSAISDAKTK